MIVLVFEVPGGLLSNERTVGRPEGFQLGVVKVFDSSEGLAELTFQVEDSLEDCNQLQSRINILFAAKETILNSLFLFLIWQAS